MGACPTKAPTLGPKSRRSSCRYSADVSQAKDTFWLSKPVSMSSTELNQPIIISLASGATGARLTEQLPMINDVTPCSGVGVANLSQHNCGS